MNTSKEKERMEFLLHRYIDLYPNWNVPRITPEQIKKENEELKELMDKYM